MIRFKYFFFIIIIILTVVTTQVVIHSYLRQQKKDAYLINLSGRQRMLSQRITKLALFINKNSLEGKPQKARLDTLRNNITAWKNAHEKLLKQTSFKTREIDSLMRIQTILMRGTFVACQSILQNQEYKNLENKLRIIEANDVPFLMNMQRIVSEYQRIAESNLTKVERIEYYLGVFSILVISAGFSFIMLPSIRKLRMKNNDLTSINDQLLTQDEELKANLDQIMLLQSHLEIKEKQYRERVEEAVDAIYETNFQGLFTYVNQSALTLTGYSQAELLKLHYYDIIQQDYKNDLIKFYENQLKNKIEVTYKEFPVVTKSDKLIWIGQTLRMIFEQSRLKNIYAVARDITAVYEFRNNLQKSEQRFKALAEHSPVGVHELNHNGEITYINKQWIEISGVSTDSTSEERLNAIHPEDKTRTLKSWATALKEKREVSLEFRFNNPKKGIVWVISRTAPIFNTQGELQGYIGTLSDITEVKETYLKLVKSEETYKLISTNSKDLITLYRNDEEATRTYISPSVKNILGYEPEELIGKSPFDIILPEDVKRIKETIHIDTLDGKPGTNEYRIYKKDGSIIWMEANSHPFFNEQGEMIGFQTSAREITQRKAFESALTEAKIKAEDANKAKSQFLSMMSHEIRTPMNAVIGITSFLIDENPSSAQLENLKLLKYSGENLLTVINDILDFSKIEAGKMDFEELSFDLIELLRNITKMMQHRAKEKELELLLIYDSTLPQYIIGDSVRINQILINLIGNAIKFTASGRIELEIKAKVLKDNRYDITFSVTDTGIGIEHDKIDLIFESFSQANKDTTRKFGGTGLGLSITKKLVDLMGGNIQLVSALGVGSKFYFTLNLKGGEVKKGIDHQLKIVNSKSDIAFNILIVEDNRVNQVVVANYLKKWGLQITFANNGIEALEKIISKSYHLVLMDIQMPEMNGYEATKRIRSMDDPYFKNIPIIALTASVLQDKTTEVTSIGFNDFITKPFNPQDLNYKIFSYLNVLSV